jgi:NAD(P)-dependent dehydrogenase (short-subunit alcohol dehydrogenase family)
MSLSGRSALVAGGAGGLGAATVQRLAGCGMHVVVLDRAPDGSRAGAGTLASAAALVDGDVNDDGDVDRAIGRARSLGVLSVVANVAGGAGRGGPVVDGDGVPHPAASFARTMVSNAFGTFNVVRLAAAAMGENQPDEHGQRGVVVNTASVAGLEGQSGQVAYAAAKAAILGMTLPLARDLAPLGIRVCAIAPGPMGTPAMSRLLGRLEVDPTEGIVFPPRLGRPAEFAQLVESIVRNPFLNGENIRLDGALRLAYRSDPEPAEG